jgi:inner membrane protein
MRLGMRVFIMLALGVAILLPLGAIRGTIHERQAYRQEAVEAVAASYAGPQVVAGPVLVVPYSETVLVEEKDPQGRSRQVERQRSGRWTYFPRTLEVRGTLQPATRRRGLHEVRVYELQGALTAGFRAGIPASPDPARPRRLGRPWLGYAIGDVRGLAGTPVLRVDGAVVELEQGQGSRAGGGVHARLPVPREGRPLVAATRLELALGGTESLALAPLADANRVVLDSPWPHPQFNGDFLPRVRRIDGTGFHAEWEISALASNAQAQYLDTVQDADGGSGRRGLEAIGVSLVDPVDVYSKVDRASKYGVLFVLLTFGAFFLFEMLKRLPIHPVQYVLVGLAIAIFFLLLLALAEHIAFGAAYVVAAGACVVLLGFYLGYVLRSRGRGIAFAAALATLYAALYGLLVSEDNALVLGSALLFALLAAAMVATRGIDWYALSQPDSRAPGGAA